jgi:dCTP deaminase
VILTDREIRIAIENKAISIEPTPKSNAYSSTSVDLTLDSNIRIFKQQIPGLDTIIRPSSPGYNFTMAIAQLTEAVEIPSSGFNLEPRSLILAWTKERLNLFNQSRIAARVEGKSSLARIGLAVHITAPTIHAGFQGLIQLEVINHGPLPICLSPGMRICQLIFEQTLGVPESGYVGQFQGQNSAT